MTWVPAPLDPDANPGNVSIGEDDPSAVPQQDVTILATPTAVPFETDVALFLFPVDLCVDVQALYSFTRALEEYYG